MTRSCKEVWCEKKNDRINQIKKLWKVYTEDCPESYKIRIERELGKFEEYGLGFDSQVKRLRGKDLEFLEDMWDHFRGTLQVDVSYETANESV